MITTRSEASVIGRFVVTAPELIVTDPHHVLPTYSFPETTVTGDLLQFSFPKAGTWIAVTHTSYEGVWGTRNAVLLVSHADHVPDFYTTWELVQRRVRVDSGQVGVYASSICLQPLATRFDWYNQNCQLVNSRHKAGVLADGVVAVSGFGEGLYNVYVAHDSYGLVVALKIILIDEYNG